MGYDKKWKYGFMKTMGDRIRAARLGRGLKQREVAAYFGIDRANISQWEKNETQPAQARLMGLADLFGGSVEWFLEGTGQAPEELSTGVNHKGQHHLPNAEIAGTVDLAGRMIPVYGQAVAGEDGEFQFNGNILFETMTVPTLAGSKSAYAVRVAGDSMSPRYEEGELVYVDPDAEVYRGDYVVVQIQHEENSPRLAYVKKLVKHTTAELILSQLNPEKTLTFPHETVVSVHKIKMGGEAS